MRNHICYAIHESDDLTSAAVQKGVPDAVLVSTATVTCHAICSNLGSREPHLPNQEVIRLILSVFL